MCWCSASSLVLHTQPYFSEFSCHPLPQSSPVRRPSPQKKSVAMPLVSTHILARFLCSPLKSMSTVRVWKFFFPVAVLNISIHTRRFRTGLFLLLFKRCNQVWVQSRAAESEAGRVQREKRRKRKFGCFWRRLCSWPLPLQCTRSRAAVVVFIF